MSIDLKDEKVAAFSSFRSIDISLKEHHAIMMIIPMSQTIRKKASWLIGLARLSNLKNIFLYKSRLVLIINAGSRDSLQCSFGAGVGKII